MQVIQLSEDRLTELFDAAINELKADLAKRHFELAVKADFSRMANFYMQRLRTKVRDA